MKFICLELAHTISRELPEFHLNFGTISNIEALSVLPMPKNGASPNKRKYIFFRECKRKYMISDEYHNLYTSPFLFSSFIFHSSTNSWQVCADGDTVGTADPVSRVFSSSNCHGLPPVLGKKKGETVPTRCNRRHSWAR
jgi:hypothetical protein